LRSEPVDDLVHRTVTTGGHNQIIPFLYGMGGKLAGVSFLDGFSNRYVSAFVEGSFDWALGFRPAR
jgi:hypothetical protein